MAKPQTFVVNPEVPSGNLKGQALRVYQELEKAFPEPLTGVELNERIENSDRPFTTRQDSLRVTLYYCVVFKGQGKVVATRPTAAKVSNVDAAYDLAGA